MLLIDQIDILGGVFIVIFVGIFLACVTLAIEYCYFKFRRHPEADDNVSPTDSGGTTTIRNKLVYYWLKLFEWKD